jgi:hypothetical protein
MKFCDIVNRCHMHAQMRPTSRVCGVHLVIPKGGETLGIIPPFPLGVTPYVPILGSTHRNTPISSWYDVDASDVPAKKKWTRYTNNVNIPLSIMNENTFCEEPLDNT